MMDDLVNALIRRLWQVMLVSSCSMVAVFVILMAEPLKKGDSHGGGIIVFVKQSNSKAPLQHGFIAASSDLANPLSWSDAKATCDSLTLNGFTDWTLPTREDLSRLLINNEMVGGFQEADYWSSSAFEPDSAWCQHFLGGKEYIRPREMRLRVRPIRKF